MENLTKENVSRIIEMAWEDRTPFEVIKKEFNLNESKVIKIMRQELNFRSFKLWRKRVRGRKTKHLHLRSFKVGRHCSYDNNKIKTK
tara:strand:+ start:1386 stop:1646 length:261 start_codon:yes stop_codon:yes gene_type:complete